VPDLAWYFPETLEDVPALLQKDGVIPHAGGTGLAASRLRRIKGLVDLRRLPLSFFRNAGGGEDGSCQLGSMLTYRETADHIAKIDESHVLVRALAGAASTPLRNRITLGGSIAYYPMWSDLMGPLIALEAELTLLGAGERRVSLADYLRKPELRQNRLITTVHLEPPKPKTGKQQTFYHRETRTTVDYPAFTLTILLRDGRAGKPEARIVLSGVKGKYIREEKLEETVGARGPEGLDENLIDDQLEAEFAPRRLGSPEYLRHLAVIAISRGLHRLADEKAS
jgi:CO/xanthine dehydrogenase FAD-binding subunit